MLQTAQTLNSEVEMSESDLRELMKKLFITEPSYHINAVARLVKKGKSESRFEGLTRKTGGIL